MSTVNDEMSDTSDRTMENTYKFEKEYPQRTAFVYMLLTLLCVITMVILL